MRAPAGGAVHHGVQHAGEPLLLLLLRFTVSVSTLQCDTVLDEVCETRTEEQCQEVEEQECITTETEVTSSAN